MRGGKPPRVSKVATNFGDVLLDEKRGQYWHLNEAAAVVFTALSEGRGENEAALRLVEQYGISVERARADAASIAGQMKENGLL